MMVPFRTIFTVCFALLEISTQCQGKPWTGFPWQPYIINGSEASPSQFPYQAGIILDRKGFCGGALISDTWVLTTAHCVVHISLFTVILGAHDVFLPMEPGKKVLISRHAFPHEKFDINSMDNDVALIKLPYTVQLTEEIQVISLPPRSWLTKDFAGYEMRISGWGKSSQSGGYPVPTLRYADITMITNEECMETYADIITDRLICGAGPNGTAIDFCNGDNGGPLVLSYGGKLAHFGVLSFVNQRGCGAGKPAVYDRTVYFLDWIANKTGISIMD